METSDRDSNRPLSYYENMAENKGASNNNVKECKFSESLSQLHCLNTTVPQNIRRQDIGGKHTPTRSSLRHSRMIVLNRSGQVTSSSTPLFLKYRKLVKFILILTILLGLSLCIVSIWFHIWSPNLESKDYWSSIPVVVSGVIGVMFVNMCPQIYNKNVNYCIRSVKYISITISAIAATAALIVFIFNLTTIIFLFSTECASYDKHDITCVCRTNSNNTSSGYHYVDLNCDEVKNVLTVLILYICVLNMVITLLKLVYLYLHWTSRNIYIYTRVPLNENTSRNSKTSS